MTEKQSAKQTRRAFNAAALMAGMEGTLDRKYPKPNQSKTKAVTVIYDHAKEVFKTEVHPRFMKEDVLRLKDGRVYEVTGTTLMEVDGEAVLQEVSVNQLEGEGPPSIG